MEISEKLKYRLDLAANKSNLSHDEFLIAVKYAFNSIVDLNASLDGNSYLPRLNSITQYDIHAGLVMLLTEATKHNLDESALSHILEECLFSQEQIKIFSTFFFEHKDRLKKNLQQVNCNYPEIIDADWRLDYHIKNSNVDRVRKPVFLIDLKTKTLNSSHSSDVQFSCTQEQLQDLITKLKDACKSAERISLVSNMR